MLYCIVFYLFTLIMLLAAMKYKNAFFKGVKQKNFVECVGWIQGSVLNLINVGFALCQLFSLTESDTKINNVLSLFSQCNHFLWFGKYLFLLEHMRILCLTF